MTAADLRFARQVERLCRFGSRPIFELLREIGGERLLREPTEAKVDDYVRRLEALGPKILAVIGADRLPSPPLHVITTSGAGGPARPKPKVIEM